MLKPYIRQQMRTDNILSSITDTHSIYVLEQILTHEDTLYNIIHNSKHNVFLREIITNTDSVVIVVDNIFKPIILDKTGGHLLDSSECQFVGTREFTIYDGVKYIIETNYKSIDDVYNRLYKKWYKEDVMLNLAIE